jgi:hypothetical protein
LQPQQRESSQKHEYALAHHSHSTLSKLDARVNKRIRFSYPEMFPSLVLPGTRGSCVGPRAFACSTDGRDTTPSKRRTCTVIRPSTSSNSQQIRLLNDTVHRTGLDDQSRYCCYGFKSTSICLLME